MLQNVSGSNFGWAGGGLKNSLCPSCSKWVPFVESGKDNEVIGKGRAPS